MLEPSSLIRRWVLAGVAAATGLTAPSAADAAGGPALALELIAPDVHRAVAIAHAGDGSGRLFLGLQRGLILIYDGEQVLEEPFLDLTSTLGDLGDNSGLLGLTFHPDYASNGFFYLVYADGDTKVSRFQVSEVDPDAADPESELILLTVDQPTPIHTGNHLAFGPDGYLYVAIGDGGTPGDLLDYGQSLAVLNGKIVRLDVDEPAPGHNYGIPPSNPFVDDPSARHEIWSYGLRNPWRFSFDRATGDLFVADVGQSRREEVNWRSASSPGGENYGWRPMEGSLCYDPPVGCDDGTMVLPILEYGHGDDCAVTGGYRYRGSQFPALAGVYLYADFCSGRIRGGLQTCAGWSETVLLTTGLAIVTFGEDEAGELYLSEYGPPRGAPPDAPWGNVYRLVVTGGASPVIFDGCFESGDLAGWSTP